MSVPADRNETQSELQLIRWGIVGPGRAAARFAEGMDAVVGARLTAVWGRNLGKTQVFGERFRVDSICSTFEQLLATDIEAVYVATHPDTHADLCIRALAAGKHVLCEKPAALNERELKKVLKTAAQFDRLFMEAMKPPFFPLYKQLREHLRVDPIGNVGFVRAGHADATLSPDYPLHFRELGGGGIMGIGPYEAFLALDWLGPLKRLQSMGRLNTDGVDNFALFQTEHERGMAQLHTGLDLLSRGDALLCGDRGYVTLHENWWNPVRATVRYIDTRTIELEAPFQSTGFNYETDHFCELIRTEERESSVITHELSLEMARMLEAARKAIGVSFPGE
jgi:scyllo-inositol 2-dehydrogenase (NADP+)